MPDLSSRDSVTLAIAGMSCGHCVRAVDAALAATPGVTDRRVAVGSAEVSLAPGATPDAAIVAIGDAGFEARVTAPASPRTPRQSGCGCGCG